jgi:protein-tyrosine phosphatase
MWTNNIEDNIQVDDIHDSQGRAPVLVVYSVGAVAVSKHFSNSIIISQCRFNTHLCLCLRLHICAMSMSLDAYGHGSSLNKEDDDSSSRDRDRASTLSARPSSMHVDMLYGHTVSPVVEGCLYLSDQQAPVDSNLLNFLGITHIVNASNESVPNKFPEFFKYYNVNVEDDNNDDLLPHFDAVCDFLADTVVEPTKTKSSAEIVSDLSHSTATMIESVVSTAVQNVDSTVQERHSTYDYTNTNTNPLHTDASVAACAGPEEQDIAMGAGALHLQEQQQPCDIVILFHCKMGISRSATLLIAYLMKSKCMTLKEAYTLVKKKRAKISPTPMFADALVKYERVVHPDLTSGTMTVFQLCGTTVARGSSGSRGGGEGDDSSDRDTVSTRSKPPLILSPITEQSTDSTRVPLREEKNSGRSCCIVM